MLSLIWSEEEVRRFISLLPDLGEYEGYMVMLIARSRIVKELFGIKIKDTPVEFKIVPWYYENWREKLLRVVRKLAVLGAHSRELYTIRGSGREVEPPPEAMGIMLVINPLNLKRALYQFMRDTLQLIMEMNDWKQAIRVTSRWYGTAHACARKVFHTIDVETKDEKLISTLLHILDKYSQPFAMIETRRGYHILIDLRRFSEDNVLATRYWREFLQRELPELQREFRFRDEKGEEKLLIEYIKHIQEPVPGTLYGGFPVRLVKVFK